MATSIAIVSVLACGVVASYMAAIRDPATAHRYRLLIILMCGIGSCLVIHLSFEPTLPLSTIILIVATWMACAVAGLNTSVNPGMSLLFALMFSIMVVLGHTEGRGALNAWVAAALTLAWLTIGWLVRKNRINPGWIPLMVIGAPLIFIEPAY